MSNLVKSFSSTKDAGVFNIGKGTIMMYVSPTGDYSSPPAGWDWFTLQPPFGVPPVRVRVRGHNDTTNPRRGECGMKNECTGLGDVTIKRELELHHHDHPERNTTTAIKGVKTYSGNNIFYPREIRRNFGPTNSRIRDYDAYTPNTSTVDTFLEPQSVSITHIIKL